MFKVQVSSITTTTTTVVIAIVVVIVVIVVIIDGKGVVNTVVLVWWRYLIRPQNHSAIDDIGELTQSITGIGLLAHIFCKEWANWPKIVGSWMQHCWRLSH